VSDLRRNRFVIQFCRAVLHVFTLSFSLLLSLSLSLSLSFFLLSPPSSFSSLSFSTVFISLSLFLCVSLVSSPSPPHPVVRSVTCPPARPPVRPLLFDNTEFRPAGGRAELFAEQGASATLVVGASFCASCKVCYADRKVRAQRQRESRADACVCMCVCFLPLFLFGWCDAHVWGEVR